MEGLNSALPKLLDLAGNFNVDIRAILIDYAEKLKTQDCSFPEAALLIQQCSEIYGRKVDYLHSLVVELSESMNSRMYQSEGSKEDDVPPRKELSHRKRKTAAPITIEDFTWQTIKLDKPKIIKKTKKKKHCMEPICVSLIGKNLESKNVFHIYEDELNNIGTKKQFRINWHLQPSCRLEENLVKIEDQNLWTDQILGEVLDIPDTEEVNCGSEHHGDCCFNELEGDEVVSVAKDATAGVVEHIIEQETYQPSEFATVENKHERLQKPKKCLTSNFKLPFELTKKGAKPESNYTHFLFSNMLKRALRMKSALPLPPIFTEKNADKKLIAKHIHFMRKRFDLDNRLNVSRSLLEQQEDFLGFEDVNLEDVPDVLTAVGLEDPPNPDHSAVPDCDAGDSFYDGPEVFVTENPLIDYNAKRKTTVDSCAAVKQWREHIQDTLKKDESKRNFDVHEYGSDILNKFQSVGEKLSFGQVVSGSNSSEVSRYFLSTLMLANTSNLLISDSNGLPNTMEITLQHRDRSHAMEDFLVPPSVGGDHEHVPMQHPARKSTENSNPSKRLLKQLPGVGPWKNKSKRKRV